MTVETVDGPNPWAEDMTPAAGVHACYVCRPNFYPPMPDRHTLCARCGQLLYVPDADKNLNETMTTCERCDAEMLAEDQERTNDH